MGIEKVQLLVMGKKGCYDCVTIGADGSSLEPTDTIIDAKDLVHYGFLKIKISQSFDTHKQNKAIIFTEFINSIEKDAIESGTPYVLIELDSSVAWNVKAHYYFLLKR